LKIHNSARDDYYGLKFSRHFWWLIQNRFQLSKMETCKVFGFQIFETPPKCRKGLKNTTGIQFFSNLAFFLIVFTKVNRFWQKLIRNVQPKNSYQLWKFSCIFFLEFWHFSEIIILLMFIQFSDGVLQLKFVSGKQENGSKFSNTL
jgi:hypothetical protein